MKWMEPQKTMRDEGEQHEREENTTYPWKYEQESETKCKRECVREKKAMWAKRETLKQQRAQERKWGREAKCKSKNSEIESTTSVMGF